MTEYWDNPNFLEPYPVAAGYGGGESRKTGGGEGSASVQGIQPLSGVSPSTNDLTLNDALVVAALKAAEGSDTVLEWLIQKIIEFGVSKAVFMSIGPKVLRAFLGASLGTQIWVIVLFAIGGWSLIKILQWMGLLDTFKDKFVAVYYKSKLFGIMEREAYLALRSGMRAVIRRKVRALPSGR